MVCYGVGYGFVVTVLQLQDELMKSKIIFIVDTLKTEKLLYHCVLIFLKINACHCFLFVNRVLKFYNHVGPY